MKTKKDAIILIKSKPKLLFLESIKLVYNGIVFIKTIKYFSLLFGLFIFAYFLSFSLRSFIEIYDKSVQNNKKIKFIEDVTISENKPLLCFQTTHKLSIKNNIDLPEIKPMGAIPNTLNISKKKKISYDKFGFRNKNHVWKNKKYDYVVMGDSVVADANIPDEYLFSNNLNTVKNFINLGCGGNGLLTSIYLLEQFLSSGYLVDNVLFFLNLDNDFSKDTPRENDIKFLRSPYTFKQNNNLFLNQLRYEEQYTDFIKDSFYEDTKEFSFLNETVKAFSKKSFAEELDELLNKIKYNSDEFITLEDGQVVNKKTLAKGMYDTKTYNIFLKILERASNIQNKYGTKITFLFVPTNHEIDVYNKNNDLEIELYLNYKYLKYSLMSTIANYNMNIIDLIYFVKKNNYKHFKKGHFTKEGHASLANYIKSNLYNDNAKNMSQFMFYTSYFPSKHYSNYQVNFGKKLTSQQTEIWINITNIFLQQNKLDNYLISPILGYLFLNQDCQSIVKLHDISNGMSSHFSVGNFLYKVCTLQEASNIKVSLKEIENLANGDVKYYLSDITREIKISLEKVNENK